MYHISRRNLCITAVRNRLRFAKEEDTHNRNALKSDETIIVKPNKLS